MADVESSIRRFIVSSLMMKKDENVLALDEPLLEKGIVDSWGIIELVEFLRREFSVQIEDSDILPENFQDVRAIAALVRKSQ